MKYVILVAVLLLCGCGGGSNNAEIVTTTNGKALKVNSGIIATDNYRIIEFEYDGCEYIAFGSGSYFSVTHKGNCKYCQQRNK